MKVEYSKTNVNDYERYCRQNMIRFNEADYLVYRKEEKKKLAYMALWFFLWIQVLYGLYDMLNQKYSYVQIDVKTMAVIIGGAVILIMLIQGGTKAIRGMFPMCVRMKKEMMFTSTVEAYLIPLYELQEVFRKGYVRKVEVDTKRSVLTAEIRTENGNVIKKYYLYGGYKTYFTKDSLDFTRIDRIIDEEIKAEGLHSY